MAVVCPTLAVLWACSSDEFASGGPGVGGAGKGGSAGSGGSGGMNAAGSAGMSAAGSAGMSAAGGSDGGGGEGGSGGEAPMAGEQCTACTATTCEAAQGACTDSTACSAWLACITLCQDAACLRQCDDDHEDAALLIAAVYDCACDACAAECQAADVCDQSCTDDPALGPITEAPATLADTGLYAQDGNGGWQLAPHVREFQPEYKLWSDGAEKTRWIYLPKCEQIDTDDMDHWDFPVGTRLWKEFKLAEQRIETRLLTRYNNTVDGWLMVSYQWTAQVGTPDPVPDPTLATLAPAEGVPDANIPSQAECLNCHGKLSERVLGFGAIQLSHDLPGVKLTDLVDWGVMTTPPTSNSAGMGVGFDPPGSEAAQLALGYLHANCGNCHNETGVAMSDTEQPQSLWLRLLVSHTTVDETHAAITAIDQLTVNDSFPNFRIDQTTPLNSVILTRMDSIVAGTRMPALRKVKDTVGYDTVLAWIEGLQ